MSGSRHGRTFLWNPRAAVEDVVYGFNMRRAPPRSFFPVFVLAGMALAGCERMGVTGATKVYSNIEVNSVSSDAGGLELELRSTRRADEALLVVCEGGCRGAKAYDVAVGARAVTFSWRVHPGDPAERFVVRRADRDLLVDQPAWAKGQVLKRVRRPSPRRTQLWAEYR
jgi:hypothetical protein